jgi:hypothetical protein
MGNSSHKVTLHGNQPSPSDRTLKSVVSDPLDELKFTDEQFWKHFADVKREPSHVPFWARMLGVHVANHEVTELSTSSFTVRDVIGGYYGTEIDVNFKHSFDPATKTWTQMADRDPSLQKVNVNVYVRLHTAPRVVEIWCVNETAKNGGPKVKATLEGMIGLMLKELGTSSPQFEVKADQPSLDASGTLVAQSGPLDNYLGPEIFIERFQNMLRQGKLSDDLVDVKTEDLPGGAGFKTQETTKSNDELETKYAIHTFDRSREEFKSTYSEEPSLSEQVYSVVARVYRQPLRIEMFVESYPKRHAGNEVIKAMKPQIHSVLAKIVAEAPKAK